MLGRGLIFFAYSRGGVAQVGSALVLYCAFDQQDFADRGFLEGEQFLPAGVGGECLEAGFVGEMDEVDFVGEFGFSGDEGVRCGPNAEEELTAVVGHEGDSDGFKFLKDSLLAGVEVDDLGQVIHGTNLGICLKRWRAAEAHIWGQSVAAKACK